MRLAADLKSFSLLCLLLSSALAMVAPAAMSQESQARESQAQQPEAAVQEAEADDPAQDAGATFDLTLSDGSRVVGYAQEMVQESTGGQVVLVGPAEILYRDIKLTADRIKFNQETKDILAEGNVIFDQGPQRLSGESLELNLDTELGRLVNAKGNAGSDYFFTGKEVLKIGENEYRVLEGQFSSCEGESPAWSFRASKVDVTVDGYAKVKNASFRAKKLPLLYFPYLLWPVKNDRASGFLIPKPGYSQRRGGSLGLAYYWAMGRSYDSTFFVDLYGGGAPTNSAGSGNYFGLGNEFRYQPSESTTGRFEGYAVRDPEFDRDRWRIKYEHQSRLPIGMRAVIDFEDASDIDYFRDYERRSDINSRRQIYSTAYLSGNWGAHSLNMNLDRRETFVSDGQAVELRQLPEIEYKLRSTRLGPSPFYLNMRSSMHYLDMQRPGNLSGSYARGDIFPEITLPIRTVPWFSLSLTAGARYTWWGDSRSFSSDPQDQQDGSGFRGQSISRFVPSGNAQIVGPSFSRIFDSGGEKFSKFKHVIEPRVLYNFADEDEDQDRVPLFDEIDRLQGSDQARFSLFNRLLAKPADEEDGGAFEILSLEISQDYSFDDLQPLQAGTVETVSTETGMTESERLTSQKGPLRTLLRYNPSRRTSVRAEARYNTLFSELDSTSLSTTLGFGKTGSLGLRWSNRKNAVTSETTTHQLRVAARLPLGSRFRVDSQLNYDIEESYVQYQRHFLRYIGSCFTIDLEYGDFNYGSGPNARRDTEWRFALSLKNVGTFLDLNGGENESF